MEDAPHVDSDIDLTISDEVADDNLEVEDDEFTPDENLSEEGPRMDVVQDDGL